ncbi:MAG: asparagine synthase [Nitrososphaerota archaeon]|nr:asparagine synthase [Nitrososphaerota archaeon]
MVPCASRAKTIRLSRVLGGKWSFETEPATDCIWVHDSTSGECIKTNVSSLLEVRRLLEETGVGDYVAAGYEDRGLAVFTDCAGSRPLFVGHDGDDYVISNRIQETHGIQTTEAVPGDTALRLGEKGISSFRLASPDEPDSAERPSLANSLELAVQRRIKGRSRVGVTFSGGLDSSLLAFLSKKVSKDEVKLLLVTVFAEGYGEPSEARKAAEMLDAELVEVAADRRICADVIRYSKGARIWRTPMDVSLGVGFVLASRAAYSKGCELLIAGQGADELFGGYAKYEKIATRPDLVARAMEYDFEHLYQGLARDAEAIRDGGCEPSFPYLDRLVVNAANSIPPEERVVGGYRKAPLRETAMELGLPRQLALAPKRAFQYSSGLEKLLRKEISLRHAPG